MKISEILSPGRVAAFSLIISATTQLHATILWDESVNGSLSASGASPTALTLSQGVNSIRGNVTGGTDTQDWVALTVPTGDQLSSLILESYVSTDMQGFFGVASGSSFTGSVNTPGNYLGYTHFGTGAANNGQSPVDLVGVDLLPIMGNNVADSPGSAGFTPPLGAGTYTFLIQQLGASTAYQFDFDVTPVPEPSPAALAGLAGAIWALAAFRRRRSRA